MFDKYAMHVIPPSWSCCAMVVFAKCPICISILGEHFAPIGTPHREHVLSKLPHNPLHSHTFVAEMSHLRSLNGKEAHTRADSKAAAHW